MAGRVELALFTNKVDFVEIYTLGSTSDVQAFWVQALAAELTADEISAFLTDGANIVVVFIWW